MGDPHKLPEEPELHELRINVSWEGSLWNVPLEPEERRYWLDCFRSSFGPKSALVDELRIERNVPEDATVVVYYDRCTVRFSPDGNIRMDIDSHR